MARSRAKEAPSTREQNVTALMDAAERLLVRVGAAGTTTRSIAAEAGLNHGLVHYYFGSMEELLLQVLERFTERLTARQREMYGAEVPFIEKWRAAMGFLDRDIESGYPKIWFELQSLAWNRPELRDRLVRSRPNGASCSPTPSAGRCARSTGSTGRPRRWSRSSSHSTSGCRARRCSASAPATASCWSGSTAGSVSLEAAKAGRDA